MMTESLPSQTFPEQAQAAKDLQSVYGSIQQPDVRANT